jgi:hypothetical protein
MYWMAEMAADGVLEVLLDSSDGSFTDRPGKVLAALASEIFDEEIKVGDVEYHAVSKAVLYLESADLVVVKRQSGRHAHQANIVLEVKIKEA